MNKICGYSCEHNKGGVCQITMCDKQPTFSSTTQNYMQIIEGTTMYYEWYVKYLQEELEEEKRINQEDLKYIDELNDRIEKTVEELELWKPKNKVIQLEIELLLNILNGRNDK